MAIEKAGLSGSLNAEEMVPVASTPAGQNQGTPAGGQSPPRRRESTPRKDSAEPPTEDADRPPHRIDRLA